MSTILKRALLLAAGAALSWLSISPAPMLIALLIRKSIY
jgi:hypothetical protein